MTERIVRLVGAVLGREVVGVYLHGSGVFGGLKPASDIDILVIARRSMDDRERRALLDGLLRERGERPVELTVAVKSEISPWRYPPTCDFLYGEWLRADFEAGAPPPRAVPMPDLALLLTVALAGDHTLVGPPLAEVLDPVPKADLIRASVAGVPGLLRNLDGDTRNVLLTLARVWTTLATGEIRTKDAAADWALTRLPPEHRPVLRHAKELYLHRRYAEEHWSDELRAQVGPHVQAVLELAHLGG
ncbi:aminoglycoside adenylyltransferase family protein [Allokutzneria sp. A3M-2-11 16]|uniref:aminoglycoside adenylyltransferase family protein n=1 Tax=Allokutzneria sp. A3M-2-11 16 TaxID=2962043 RepID=UPI0020B8702C|nr:aminoglycoside adenylyltransferase family protein [Allokutzneria sp. A3M-2-11 16]MCP3798393.1 aminoglycoside adenylyltransferase family protein [Allokutzneria sp. A3M-2-11 16]